MFHAKQREKALISEVTSKEIFGGQLGGAVQVIVDVLVELHVRPHSTEVVEDDPRVEALHRTGLSDLSVRIQSPEVPERDPVVRRKIRGYSDHLIRTKVLELLKQFGNVDSEFQVDVQHDELVVGKNSETIDAMFNLNDPHYQRKNKINLVSCFPKPIL